MKQNRERKLLAVAIILLSLNLRAAITSVGPLVAMIQGDLGISGGAAGMITTIPLLAWAAVSPLVGRISGKIGEGKSILMALIILVVGVLVRSYLGTFGLFFGTILAGAGIAFGNVLIPVIIKSRFGDKIGMMTSVFTASMCIFAGVSAAVSAPLAMAGTWQSSLAVWAVPALIVFVLWVPFRKLSTREGGEALQTEKHESVSKGKNLLSSPVAAWVAIFMGVQSLFFYCYVAWLPLILQAKGFDTETAGFLYSIFQFVGIPANFVIPVFACRTRDQRSSIVVVGVLYLLSIAATAYFDGVVMIALAVVVSGFCSGACISLAMLLINMRTRTPQDATRLSGVSQSVGYLIAAIGPFLLGFIYDISASWTVTLTALMLFMIPFFISGWCAGKDRFVE